MVIRLVLACSTKPSQPAALAQERGISFNLGPSFYRPQSCFSRDLAVLSAATHRCHRQHQEQQQLLQLDRQTPQLQQRQQEQQTCVDQDQQQTQQPDGLLPPPPPLHVLDLMAGSGIRSMRYLLQAGADHVLCNEADPANRDCLDANLSAAAAAAAAAGTGTSAGRAGGGHREGNRDTAVHTTCTPGGGRQWRVQGCGDGADLATPDADLALPLAELAHEEAASLLMRCRLEGRFFDLIDIDSFGAAARCVGLALDAVRYGGMVCLTSTAGTLAGGRDPVSAQALYGMHLAPMPYANEQGLRMLIGLAQREALARRLSIRPLWSLYSPHGPVFRTMLQVQQQPRQRPTAAQRQQQQYGYMLHWPGSGESSCCGWQDLPAFLHSSSGGSGGSSGVPLLSGPLWLGPLHDHAHLLQLQAAAADRGWLQEAAAGKAGPEAASNVAKGAANGAAAAPAAAPAAPVLPATKKGSIGSLRLLLDLLLEEAAAEAAGETAAEAAAGVAAPALLEGGQVPLQAAAEQPAGLHPQQSHPQQQQQHPQMQVQQRGGHQQQQQHLEQEQGGQRQQQQRQRQQRLPPWYIRMNDVGRVGSLVGPPSRDHLATELRRRGFLAARSHVDPGALKTSASMAQAVEAAVQGLGIRSRAQRGGQQQQQQQQGA